MLREMGLDGIESLFNPVPENLRLTEPLGIGEPVSEPQLIAYFRRLAASNGSGHTSFLGAGAYSHFIPTIVDPLISRAEFFTAYTPYQPELSQGTLQSIFEFQTMICQLTGMEVSNASQYDGSTALAEAVLMASRLTRRDNMLIADTVHPEYREVVDTYTRNSGEQVHAFSHDPSGRVDADAIEVDEKTAAVVVQSPNFFGCIEDLGAIADKAHSAGALLIVVMTEPMSLGVLNPPGAFGADIVVGEGQSFGVPVSYGGPYVGLFATLEKYVRQMPGRLVGEAYDDQGRRGYVLTLSTREQHIRREKATSNICTNQGLCALMATVYLATMGRTGIREVARQNLQKAHYAAERIASIKGFGLKYDAPFFNEFVVRTPIPAAEISSRAISRAIIPGLPLARYYPGMEDAMLVCVTETASREEIDSLVGLLSEVADQ